MPRTRLLLSIFGLAVAATSACGTNAVEDTRREPDLIAVDGGAGSLGDAGATALDVTIADDVDDRGDIVRRPDTTGNGDARPPEDTGPGPGIDADGRDTGTTDTGAPDVARPDTGVPPGPVCERDDINVIEPGEVRWTLCAADDSFENIDQADCEPSDSQSADTLFAFELDAPTRVRLDVRDDDDGAAIDTFLYVRRACDDPASQVACSDDIPCDESDIDFGCTGGVQPRQSRLDLELDPGTWYAVVDHYRYNEFGCGVVLLSFETEPL